MTSIHFTDADRDAQGFVKAPAPPAEPRSLAELMPPLGSPPTIGAPPIPRQQLIIAGALILLALILAAYAASRAPTRPAAPSAAPLTAAALAMRAAPTAAPTPPVARSLIAFASPDGTALGAIESTRVMTATAHAGNIWVQADVQGSGLIWLRAADVPDLAIVGPDLTPPTPAPARPVATDPPPIPTQCAHVGTADLMIARCGTESLDDLQAAAQAAWIAQSGANVVPVQTATPYPVK